jgi:hypothetical protein
MLRMKRVKAEFEIQVQKGGGEGGGPPAFAELAALAPASYSAHYILLTTGPVEVTFNKLIFNKPPLFTNL